MVNATVELYLYSKILQPLSDNNGTLDLEVIIYQRGMNIRLVVNDSLFRLKIVPFGLLTGCYLEVKHPGKAVISPLTNIIGSGTSARTALKTSAILALFSIWDAFLNL